jgi:hypothetical protein
METLARGRDGRLERKAEAELRERLVRPRSEDSPGPRAQIHCEVSSENEAISWPSIVIEKRARAAAKRIADPIAIH